MEYNNYSSVGGYVQVPISDKSVTSELSGDFTLPDYQPEIKRLLRITATVLPASKYIGDREAEFAGNIDYYVLYTGSDNEVYCAPLTADYKIGVPIENAGDMALANMMGYAMISPDMISGRVTSPRKLSIKCRLRARARIFGDMPIEDGFDKADGSTEILRGSEPVSRTVCCAGEILRVSDEIISNTGDGELRVIGADGKALVNEVTCSDGSVNCRGDLYLKLLMSKENGTAPYSTVRKIPFSQTIASEGVGIGSTASANATVSEMNITVDDGRVGIDVGMMIESCACKQERMNYIKDIYSTAHEAICEYKTVEMPRAAHSFNGNFTLGETMTLEEAGIAPSSTPVDVSGSVYAEDYSFENGRCAVNGKAKFNILLEKEGEYSTTDIEMPFRYETDITSLGGLRAPNALAQGEVVNARARFDGERLGIDAEVSMSGNVWDSGEVKMLDNVSFGDEIKRNSGEYVVCFPTESDSLWSVAKRYGTPLSSVTQANMLSDTGSPDSADSLDGASYLII